MLDEKENSLLHLVCRNAEKKFTRIVEEILERAPNLLNLKNVDGIEVTPREFYNKLILGDSRCKHVWKLLSTQFFD